MAFGTNTSDVVIVGGGVAGCAAALFISGMGYSVRLFEKDGIANHASGFAFGSIQPQIVKTPTSGLLAAALDIHKDLSETLPAESGLSYGFIEKSSVLLAISEKEAKGMKAIFMEGDKSTMPKVSAFSWLNSAELAHMEPRLNPDIHGGAYSDGAYQLDPYRFTLSMWYAAERKGAVLSRSAVDGILTKGGRANGVIVGEDMYYADSVVVAGGAWSPLLLRKVGVSIPIEPLKGQILRLSVPEPALTATFSWRGDYAATKPDNLLWVGTTDEREGFDDAPTEAGKASIMASASSVFHYLKDAKVQRHTACIRPVLPDNAPVIGEIPSIDNLIVLSGAGRNGIALAPAMGMATAELIVDKHTKIPIESLSPKRFI